MSQQYYTGDVSALLLDIDPNTRIVTKLFAIGGSRANPDSTDIAVLRANCVVSASPSQFTLTSDALSEAKLEIEYQTGASTWTKSVIDITSTKTHSIPSALSTYLKTLSLSSVGVRYVTSTGINTVTPINSASYWARELEISRSRQVQFSLTTAPVVLAANLLLSTQAEFYIDKASIILPNGALLSDWKLKTSGLLAGLLSTVTLTRDPVEIPNWNSTSKTAIKFYGTNALLSLLTTLTVWGEFTQRASVTGASVSFATPVVTQTLTVTEIRLGLILGGALHGSSFLMSASDGATVINAVNENDNDAAAVAIPLTQVIIT